ncbi:hypothetical protein ND486_05775 [Pseudonocardia sp. DR1-2]|uniref:hypothetical protein n=1 Tax=Pseudonocardia sp. DR1-2 TaxID=2951168 RepID=UPI0020431564|nr:hypothetical protein [Pseudonocardia sp. DR1-2]MCM3845706.1 hypothetical protein [Pseudonocardia sp. DR1-2]
MRLSGPLLTMVAVGAVAAGAATANVVLTAEPEPLPAAVEQAAGSSALPAAPAPTAAPAPAATGEVVYKGRSTNGKVTVDIWVTDGAVKAYVCDNRGIESWTKGTATPGGTTRLTGEDGAEVEYTVADGVATGTARADGRSWDFTATRTDASDPAPAATPAPAPADAPAEAPAPSTGGSGYGGGY